MSLGIKEKGMSLMQHSKIGGATLALDGGGGGGGRLRIPGSNWDVNRHTLELILAMHACSLTTSVLIVMFGIVSAHPSTHH